MAFDNTSITATVKGRDIHLAISASNAQASDEAAYRVGVQKFRIYRSCWYKGAGTAATIAPTIGVATAASGPDLVVVHPAATTHDDDLQGYPVYSPNGTIYLKCGTNAGNDNVITGEITIRKGWQ